MISAPRQLSGLFFLRLGRFSNRVGVVRIEKKESQTVLQGGEIVRIRRSTKFKDKDRCFEVSNSWVDLDDRLKCSATVHAEVVIYSFMDSCSVRSVNVRVS